jgi:hypothetical protein
MINEGRRDGQTQRLVHNSASSSAVPHELLMSFVSEAFAHCKNNII